MRSVSLYPKFVVDYTVSINDDLWIAFISNGIYKRLSSNHPYYVRWSCLFSFLSLLFLPLFFYFLFFLPFPSFLASRRSSFADLVPWEGCSLVVGLVCIFLFFPPFSSCCVARDMMYVIIFDCMIRSVPCV
jgi:hypothetical protein